MVLRSHLKKPKVVSGATPLIAIRTRLATIINLIIQVSFQENRI